MATVNLTAGKPNYEYMDKIMGAKAKYYYQLAAKETIDSLGLVATRPFFSPPAT